ncbi:hypothetical protein POM88_037557 [Heracleum sosnowskyi]|uniref:Uncharacterized protein n=1 Tax=Heracleum sosnowskyi TaxID=360622 RepID=A0AAD8HQG2_9APIA|nr:hypothetical protein POM88_037557 [Heracleum sosnowskyi]
MFKTSETLVQRVRSQNRLHLTSASMGGPRVATDSRNDPPNYDDRYDYNEHRDKGYRNYRNHDRYERRDNVLKIKIDAPKFDGRFDPIAFSDWLSSMDKFFDWHMMSEYRMVRFARIKLVKQAIPQDFVCYLSLLMTLNI